MKILEETTEVLVKVSGEFEEAEEDRQEVQGVLHKIQGISEEAPKVFNEVLEVDLKGL